MKYYIVTFLLAGRGGDNIVRIDEREPGDKHQIAVKSSLWNDIPNSNLTSPTGDYSWVGEAQFLTRQFAEKNPLYRCEYIPRNQLPSYYLNSFEGQVS